MSSESLHIYMSPPDGEVEIKRNVFAISEDIDDYGKWPDRLISIDIPQQGVFSYDIFLPHLIRHDAGNLRICILLYSELSDCIDRSDIEKIVTHDLEREYQLVVEDLTKEYDIRFNHEQEVESEFLSSLTIVLNLSVLYLLIDQILSIITRLGRTDSTTAQNPLFFPYPDRYESMTPVIEETESTFNIIVTPLTLSWRLLNPVSYWPAADRTRTLTEFADPLTIGKQIKVVLSLQMVTLSNNIELGQKIHEELSNTYDIQLPKTIEHVCREVLCRDIRLILSLYLIENAIRKMEPSCVVVGGMNPRDRYALKIGREIDANLFYIPHGIAGVECDIPNETTTTYFTYGRGEEKLLRETYSDENLPHIVSSGQPHLDELTDQASTQIEPKVQPQVILATQPDRNWIRRKFVSDALKTLDSIEYEMEIIIKTHPDEDKMYYSRVISQCDYELDISIKSGNMSSYITEKSILITINSTVAIEAIVLGAFCLVYNPFEGFLSPPSYIYGKRIPYATTIDSLHTHLSTVFREQRSEKLSQINEMNHLYNIGNSAEEIAKLIQ